jgi:hypothetical protein
MGTCSIKPSNHEDQELEDVHTKEGAVRKEIVELAKTYSRL